MEQRPPARTKERLLRTAERLFALHGIDAVSMRAICSEAGQRNNTALQYHFGDKQNLVETILAERMRSINAGRQAMLDQLLEDGRGADLRWLVAAAVTPFIDQLCDEDGGRYYVRFLAQLFSRGNAIELLARHRPSSEAFHGIVELIRAQLVDLPEDVVASRLALVAGQLVHAAAAKDYELADLASEDRRESIRRFATELVDFMVGGLTAPAVEADWTIALEPRQKPMDETG